MIDIVLSHFIPLMELIIKGTAHYKDQLSTFNMTSILHLHNILCIDWVYTASDLLVINFNRIKPVSNEADQSYKAWIGRVCDFIFLVPAYFRAHFPHLLILQSVVYIRYTIVTIPCNFSSPMPFRIKLKTHRFQLACPPWLGCWLLCIERFL